MASQSQLDLLLELHALEKILKSGKGKLRKEAELQYQEIYSKIEARVLKHYERHDVPFSEFRDRTCMGCGMVYPETHIHCRPRSDVIRLCENCGRILVDADEPKGTGADPLNADVPGKRGVRKGKVEAVARNEADSKAGSKSSPKVKPKAKTKIKTNPTVDTAKSKKTYGAAKPRSEKQTAKAARKGKAKT
jgi:ribosomal protein S27E